MRGVGLGFRLVAGEILVALALTVGLGPGLLGLPGDGGNLACVLY